MTNSLKDVDEVELYTKFPHLSEPYLEVIFQEELYRPLAEYLCLQIIALGGGLLACCCETFIWLPLLFDWEPYRAVWRLFRLYICRCVAYDDPHLGRIDRKSLFTHAFLGSEGLEMKKHLAREIRSLIS